MFVGLGCGVLVGVLVAVGELETDGEGRRVGVALAEAVGLGLTDNVGLTLGVGEMTWVVSVVLPVDETIARISEAPNTNSVMPTMTAIAMVIPRFS